MSELMSELRNLSANIYVAVQCDMLSFHQNFLQDTFTHWGQDKVVEISRSTFEMHFLEWKYMNFDWYYIEVCS